jgi:2-oxoglutarate ferredoxin oxidoreductase subunit delta
MPVKGRIEVNEILCKACELCIDACSLKVIELAQDRFNSKGYHPAQLVVDGCTGCAICALVCPEAAITVYREALREKAGVHP